MPGPYFDWPPKSWPICSVVADEEEDDDDELLSLADLPAFALSSNSLATAGPL